MTQEGIAKVIRRKFPVLTKETPIRRAAALLVEARSAAAPVVGDDDSLVGLLTQKDCFSAALNASYYREWKGIVADHMSRDVISVDIDDELIKVAELFLSLPHRVFPVLDGRQVKGLIHRPDILGELVRLG